MAQKEIITLATDKGKKLFKLGKLRYDELEDPTLYKLHVVECYGTFTFAGQEFIVNRSTVFPNSYLITHRPTGLAITERGEPFPHCATVQEAIDAGTLLLKRNPEVLKDRVKKFKKLRAAVLKAQNELLTQPTTQETKPKRNRTYLNLFKLGLCR